MEAKEEKDACELIDLRLLKEVLPTEFCDEIIDYVVKNGNFSSSKIGVTSEVSKSRVSQSTRLSLDCDVYKRLLGFVKTVDPKFVVGEVQVVRYQKGGFFDRHVDVVDGHKGRSKSMFVYLSSPNDYDGGKTIFPFIPFEVKGNKGDVLKWVSVDTETKTVLKESIHEGAVVTRGTKYGMNIWSTF